MSEKKIFTESETALAREFCRQDFYFFVRWMFYHNKNIEWQKNGHHDIIARAMNDVFQKKTTRLVINIAPRYGKCIDPSARVMTARGMIEAQSIMVGDDIYTYDEGKLTTEKCLGIEPARKRSLKLTMRSGRLLTMSHDHPMLGIDGYTNAEDFIVGDRIRCINAEVKTDNEIDDDELAFIAFMIFEGNCTGKNIRFSGDANQGTATFLEVCARLNIEVKQYASSKKYDYCLMGGQSGIANQLLVKYGLAGCSALNKRLPQAFFTLSMRQKLRFIDIMFATDGYVCVKAGQLGVTLANQKLIDDIQQLMSTCGVISTISFKKNDHANAWVLQIGREESIKLLPKISFYHKRDNALRLLDKEPQGLVNTYPSSIVKGIKGFWAWAKVTKGRPANKANMTQATFDKCADKFPELEKYRNIDFYWDTIKNIEDVGETDLVHLSINRTHNFIVEGLVSHNTEMVIVMFSAWAFGLHPDSEFIHASYSAALAGENSFNVKNIITHPEYQAIFPDVTLRADSKAKDHWKTTAGGVFYSTGTGGALTGYGAGKERREFGGCVLLDDLHKSDEARSDVMRNNVIEWYSNTLASRVNSKDTPIVLIMQRLHEQDLAGWLLDGGSGEKWEHINIPAINPDGTALWPLKHTIEKLREMEMANPYNFSGQYLQMPSPPDGGLFRPEQLKMMEVLPAERITWVRGWDLASSTNGDFTVGAKLGRLPDGRLIIGDIVRMKVNADERDAIIQNTAAFDGNMCKISLPQDPGQAGKTQVLYLTRSLQGYRVVSSAESGNKVTRAEPFAAQVNIGNVYMLRGVWNQALINEMRMFPNGKNDDQIDALSRCFEQLLTGGMGFKISNAALERASIRNRYRF